MKLAIVGGIYAKGGGRTDFIKVSPETILEAGCRDAGHDVTTLSHYDAVDFRQFDVVHVHHLSYGAARLASDPSHTPFVFTAHDASHMCGWKLSAARKMAMGYVLSRADATVCLSPAEARFQHRTYRLQGATEVIIPNGIDAEQYPFRRSNGAGDGQPWRLVFAGQLIPFKRCDLAIGAIARLNLDVELTLAYQNPALEAELRSLAASLGIADRIKFAGKHNPAQLADLYQRSDLLVLPSENEALPSVITEAMLTGLPFVTTTVGGIPEQSGGFGSLLTRPTVEMLADNIAHVLTNYATYSASSQKMSDYARRTFSIPAMISDHLRLYETLVGRPVRQPVRRASTHPLRPDSLIRAAVHHWGRAGHPAHRNPPVTAQERI